MATLLPPEGFAQIADVAALCMTAMDVPSAFAAGVFLSLREKIGLRITGDRTAWSPEWGTLEDIGAKTHH